MKRPLAIVAALGLGLMLAGAAPVRADVLVPVTTVPLPAQAHGTVVAGTLAYVATAQGLTIVDVTNPAAPFVRGSVATGAGYESQGVAVQGTYAYLAAGYGGVFVIDVSNPDAPAITGKIALKSEVRDVAVKGHIVYATGFRGLLSVVNVSNPAKPVLVRNLGLITWKAASGDAKQMAKLRAGTVKGNAKSTSVFVVGDHLFANDWNYGRLYYFDITDPSAPQFAGTHYAPFIFKVAADPARDVVYMLSAYGKTSGIYTVPLSRLDPFQGSHYSTCPECRFLKSAGKLDHGGMVLSGDRIYYAGGVNEFRAIDVSDPASMTVESSAELGVHGLSLAETLGVATVDGYVVLGAGSLGFKVYQHSAAQAPPDPDPDPTPDPDPDPDPTPDPDPDPDPTPDPDPDPDPTPDPDPDPDPTPDPDPDPDPVPPVPGALTPVGALGVGAQAHGVAVVGNLAYVATGTGLAIVDISTPSAPVLRGSVATGSGNESQGLAVQGAYAYLAAGTSGVYIVDVSNPSAPTIVGRQTLASNVWDVAVKGSYVYAAGFGGLLHVIDVGNPLAPAVVKTLGLLAWKDPGSDAVQMEKMRNQYNKGSAKATSVFVTGDHLFTNDWNYGRVYYYDISNPANPQFAGTHYAPFVLKVAADPARDVVYMLSAYGKTSGIYTVPLSRLDPFQGSSYLSCAECRYLPSASKINQGGMALSAGTRHIFYAGGIGEFRAVDLTNPSAMVAETTTTIGSHNLALAETLGVAIAGDHVLLGAGDLGLLIYGHPQASQ